MDWKNFDIENYIVKANSELLNDSQKNSLFALNFQLREHGAIIADEVGTGKTRIACALIDYISNIKNGRVAVVIPRGLITQWLKELRSFTELNPIIITNFKNLIDSYVEITTTNRPVFISQTFRYPIVKLGSDEWKYLFLALVLYLKKSEKNFDDFRSFARGKAVEFIRRSSNNINKTEVSLVQWAQYFVDKKYLFFNQQVRTLQEKYPFNFGDESSFHSNAPGYKMMVNDVLPKMLGFFDLIVVDEAHKGKGCDSIINNLLKIINAEKSKLANQRILGMTATPIELHEDQWIQLLERIKVEDDKCKEIKKIIKNYSSSFRALTNLKTISDKQFLDFQQRSKDFENNVGKYVTRREKEIDPKYLERINAVRVGIHPHREYKTEFIRFCDLKAPESKKWVFLHECLSQACKGMSLRQKGRPNDENDNSLDVYEGIKRLDSYFSRGHIRSFDIGKIFTEENKNKVSDNFKFERAKFFGEKWIAIEQPLFRHPKIRKAIEIIENYTKKNEKILVFGCFSGSIKTLERCLNARYILKRISDNKIARIPEDFFRDKEQKDIFEFEASDLQIDVPSESVLISNDNEYEKKRKKIRERVDAILKNNEVVRALNSADEQIIEKTKRLITARATDEILYSGDLDFDSLIKELLREVASDSKIVKENEEKSDITKEEELSIQKILNSVPDKALSGSEYAMILDGSTDFLRRSIIQTEFNRLNGFPRVLIAQSQVGKEGLNLHEACSVVLLFNADWNPGVIEQQIGRVDRLKSHWEKKKNEWLETSSSEGRPVIEIIELHFEGTYDQVQWEKLQERKHTLIYHLYNSVDVKNVWTKEDEARILKVMPNFSPKAYLSRNNRI
jgi:superfamily II DNA or RNA helicase